MTRKDYALIAAALKLQLTDKGGADVERGYAAGLQAAVYAIADAFEDDNPRFDRKRFFAAVGI